MTKRNTVSEFIARAVNIHDVKYNYTKSIYVNLNTSVEIICPDHGAFWQTPNNHIRGGQGCPTCGLIKRQDTIMLKYGANNPMKSSAVAQKVASSKKEKYGSPAYNNRDKCKITMQSRYGVDHYTNRDKCVQTMLERHGVEHNSLLSNVVNKRIQTSIKRYGTPHFKQHHMSSSLALISDIDWLSYQYITLGKTAEKIADELNISDATVGVWLKKAGIAILYGRKYSISGIEWLTYMSETHNIHIQHALNGGEYAIPNTRFRADGYCVDNNTIYEFYGDIYHGNIQVFPSDYKCHPFSDLTTSELYSKTMEREMLLISMGYNVVSIWEHDWNTKHHVTIDKERIY